MVKQSKDDDELWELVGVITLSAILLVTWYYI